MCFEKYFLRELNLKRLNKLKTTTASSWRCKHVVYQGRDFYYKIWGLSENFGKENYIKRCQNFLTAFELGIFDNISPLQGIMIDDEGLCCGYVTKKCRPVNDKKIKWKLWNGTRRFIFVEDQPTELILFWEKLVAVCQKSGYVFYDFTPLSNLGELNGEYVLIDLDYFFSVQDVEGNSSFAWKDEIFESYSFFDTVVSKTLACVEG